MGRRTMSSDEARAMRRRAATVRDEQFDRDLRGDHDSPWSYGPWLGDPLVIRTIAEVEAEDWDEGGTR